MHKSKFLSLALLTLISTSLFARSSFIKGLEEMELAMQKMMDGLNEMFESPPTRLQGSPTTSVSIQNDENVVIISIPLKNLKQEDINAEVSNNVFTLKAHNNDVDLQMNIDGIYIEMRLAENQTIEKGEDENKSKRVYTSSQSIMQSLPTEVMIDDVAVEYNDETLKVKLPKVKKEIKRVPVKVTSLQEASK